MRKSMKITKTFVSVFFITFLIGYVSVLPTYRVSAPEEITNVITNQIPSPPITTKMELEIIEDVGNWFEDGKYQHKIKLLETGEGFHGDEVDAVNGETWLGLFKENDKYFLRSTQINIRRVHDEIVDDDNKRKKTGKDVSVKGKNKPIFLLKNANNLRVSEITTLFQGVTWKEFLEDKQTDLSTEEVMTVLNKGFNQKYEIGGKNYDLKVIEAKNKDNEKILALTLESGGKRQILHTMNVEYNSSLGILHWAGDLDRDSKPDFFLELYVHDNVDNKVLFLSSQAQKDKLVKKVADFLTTGC
jgi:hypothetical protein